MDNELKNAILEWQGELLYSTFAEECAEIIQALSNIQRKKFCKEIPCAEVDNLLKEINDVLINIDLMKEQLCREKFLNFIIEDIDKLIKDWQNKKEEKLKKIFYKRKLGLCQCSHKLKVPHWHFCGTLKIYE